MTTIYYIDTEAGKRVIRQAEGFIHENGTATATIEDGHARALSDPAFFPSHTRKFARHAYFTDRMAAAAALPAEPVDRRTIFIAKAPHNTRGGTTNRPEVMQTEALIYPDGSAAYGPPGYEILHTPAGSFGTTAEEALAIYMASHTRPEPLYAIPTLPADAPVRTVNGGPARKRFVHSLTIDDVQTCATIAAGTCRLICRPLSEFAPKRTGGRWTGLAAAHPGDLIWIREPHTIYTARRGGEAFLTTAADDAAAQANMTRENARWQSFNWNRDYKESRRAASAMARYQSRLVLVVTHIYSGRNAPLLSFLTPDIAALAGYTGDDGLDRYCDALRAQFDERAFGINPRLLLIEFAAYHANIDGMLTWLQPAAGQMRRLPHEGTAA